ncbi:MAG: hypothetical protein WBB94_04070 [Candidatus Saccharimonadaceae bacterium]
MSELLSIVNTIVLVAIFILLWVTAQRKADPQLDVRLRDELDAIVDRLGRAVQHHVEVSAVVELVRQLDADPKALELIKSYPETVRAAAWLHYINTLGEALQHAQTMLASAYCQDDGNDRFGFVRSRRERVNAIRAELDAAIAASGGGGLRTV